MKLEQNTYYFRLIGKDDTYTSQEFKSKTDAVISFANSCKETNEYVWGQLIEVNPNNVEGHQKEVILTLDCNENK